MVESTDSGLELADLTTDSAADAVKISMWVQAFMDLIGINYFTNSSSKDLGTAYPSSFIVQKLHPNYHCYTFWFPLTMLNYYVKSSVIRLTHHVTS